jgi:enamine deaminase RidA (YjgF/YER057c/UK114 family)
MSISPDIAAQTEQALSTIEAVLKEVGCGITAIVRVRYILPDRREFPLCFPVLRRYFGAAPPAATMIEARLLDDRMKIEIEATARLPDQP